MTDVLAENTAVFSRANCGVDFHDSCPLWEHYNDLMASLLSPTQRTAVLNLMTSVLSENTEAFSPYDRGVLREHRGSAFHDRSVLQG
jgi:hypothetical protein